MKATPRNDRRPRAHDRCRHQLGGLPVSGASQSGGRHRSAAGESERDHQLVTQRQASELVGCSKDTIIRARLAGRFPHASLDGPTWMVSIGDLIAAGLYDPAAESQVDQAHLRQTDNASGPSTELARAEARLAAFEELVARQDEELRFLRQLTVDTLGKRATS